MCSDATVLAKAVLVCIVRLCGHFLGHPRHDRDPQLNFLFSRRVIRDVSRGFRAFVPANSWKRTGLSGSGGSLLATATDNQSQSCGTHRWTSRASFMRRGDAVFRKRVCYLTRTGTLIREKRVEILANRRGKRTSGLTQRLWSENKRHVENVTADQSGSVPASICIQAGNLCARSNRPATLCTARVNSFLAIFNTRTSDLGILQNQFL